MADLFSFPNDFLLMRNHHLFMSQSVLLIWNAKRIDITLCKGEKHTERINSAGQPPIMWGWNELHCISQAGPKFASLRTWEVIQCQYSRPQVIKISLEIQGDAWLCTKCFVSHQLLNLPLSSFTEHFFMWRTATYAGPPTLMLLLGMSNELWTKQQSSAVCKQIDCLGKNSFRMIREYHGFVWQHAGRGVDW